MMPKSVKRFSDDIMRYLVDQRYQGQEA